MWWPLHGSLVALVDFSPKEKFMVTWANGVIHIWDLKTGLAVKTFQGSPSKQHGWPVFKWSADEKYFARIVEDNIHVFETTTMSLVQPNPKVNSTLYIPGVSGFEWSPSENLLAYWVPESGDKPARVVLLRVVKKEDAGEDECPVDFLQITQKNFFLVADIKAHWHEQGDFLGVKVDRFAKKGKDKAKVTSFDLFRVRSKQVAVEMIEIPSDVVAFAWEPRGTRFGVIYKGKTGNSVTFYQMGNPKSGTVKKLETLEDRQCDHLFWSPKGNHVVLAGLSSQATSGPLEFYDVQNRETMGQTEHYLCTDLNWDPSGRYIGTSVSSYRYQMENGFKVWTFQGKLLHSVSKEKFWQFLWRPHPPMVLSEERQKKILKNLKERASEYERQQKDLDQKEAEQLAAEKKKKLDDFYTFYNARKEEMRPLTHQRRKARRDCGWDSDDETQWRTVQDTYEEVVSVEETLVEA
jgi:translation initiation factor 3 subunit B